jgi:ubiquinone/menaquinone biosynthesis C-methylase UbiE
VAFEELKERQSYAWGNGKFEKVSETIADVHEAIVEALRPQAGELWLDLACGPGAVAERAAQAGATVTGIDFAPVLIETAKRLAQEKGLDIEYRVGDAEDLADVEDESFDVVSSSFGVIFGPDHRAVARELARVTRPGGRLALTAWTPDGGAGLQFKAMAPFQPPPPEGAGSPLEWGRPEYVEELLGDVFDLRIEERVSIFTSGSVEEAWRLFSENLGPMKTAAESLDEEGREEFHRAWVDSFESNYRSDGSIEQPREYLLVLGTRKSDTGV